MNKFVPGQRWISKPELQMGLGTVTKIDFRSVTLVFLATGETRTYSTETAPLTRVAFTPGDSVKSFQGWSLRVENIEENDGLITYSGRNENGEWVKLPEGELDNFIQLNRPSDRLLSGQIDQSKWFELRYKCLMFANELAHSEIYGLTGTRTSLIPHQLYIAHEVANRFAPRVLLADEVGLGKTIEAGMILHHQLVTGRASRVLIVVPDNLIHQWLVEMLRRFNLHFAIFDDERFEGEKESAGMDNPFHTEQFILCTLSFIVSNNEHLAHAVDGNWDLLVVDEAHHLEWSPQNASKEYQCVDQLARSTKGVLLLTATPEQLGKESHYARLRLLDPDRFPSYESFIREEAAYEPVAMAIETLFNEQELEGERLDVLRQTISEGDNQQWLDCLQDGNADSSARAKARQELIDHLLDRHGTGRVLFRNTRAAIRGFPERQVKAYELELPQQYQFALNEGQSAGDIEELLAPELRFKSRSSSDDAQWTTFDPRVDWLVKLLKSLRPDKVLVIAANRETVLDLTEVLRARHGIHAAVFHEEMTIIERDRAAAFFADDEYGSQVLLCSEIGSEGRNFQFAHHLVLFDLPLNPDLLEQRIGRLDRIGQTETIKIHVPFLSQSAHEVLYRWYSEGLVVFEHTSTTGAAVYAEFRNDLFKCITGLPHSLKEIGELIEKAREMNNKLIETLQRGRDRLLEYNSCRPMEAEKLKQYAENIDADPRLDTFMEQVFDCYGVDIEQHTKSSYVLHPSDHMQSGSFPSLNPEGMTVTFDRATALSNEDMHFLTWEHPMVSGAMDLIMSQEYGNSAMIAIKKSGLKPGMLLLESVYLLESAAKASVQISQYFPPITLRIVLDGEGNVLNDMLTHDMINSAQSSISNQIMYTVVRTHSDEIKTLISNCDDIAAKMAPEEIDKARSHANTVLQKEIDRLNALKGVNPNIRDDEITFFENQRKTINELLDDISPRLEAIRVIVTT